MILKKPELLAPAGDLEKLKFAVHYGADAVYVGGTNYSLRQKSKNFDDKQLEEGVRFAHAHNTKLYVACNIFAHNDDLINLENYFKTLESIKVDGIIVADPGVFLVAKNTLKNTEIHISTQANNTNYKTAEFWQGLGASRIVLARELSITEIKHITSKTTIDVEAFVHGAMCISYSGRCLLSNYMSNRDSNRGSCTQSCRWNYYLVEEKRPNEYLKIEEDNRGTYIFNSKDLCLVQHVKELINAGITSFKIEGRMKSSYYVATTVKAYREAIDDFFNDEALYESKKDYYFSELQKNSHRNYMTGFYFDKTDEQSQIYDTNSYIRTHDFVGIILEYDDETGYAKVEQRNKIVLGDTLELFRTKGDNTEFVLSDMLDDKKNPITEAPHPQQIIYIKLTTKAYPFELLRKEFKI